MSGSQEDALARLCERQRKFIKKLVAQRKALVHAATNAQCECSPSMRLSGHVVGCWMPELEQAIVEAR